MKRRTLAWLAVVLAIPMPVLAQNAQNDDTKSHFGAIVNFGLPSDWQDTFSFLLANGDATDISSQDFEIGLARGRQLGGDWGVSYIQKTYKEGSFSESLGDACFDTTCLVVGARDTWQDVRLRGIAFYKFAPFVTIKRRAQIGITFGGAFTKVSGHAERHTYDIAFPNNSGSAVQTETVTQVDGKDVFTEDVFLGDWLPLWRVEATAAVIAAPGLKVRFGGGLNYANYPAFSIGASYLIGSK